MNKLVGTPGSAVAEGNHKDYPVPNKIIALSFDDGPALQTEILLHLLEEHKVKATFFLIGGNIRAYHSKAQAIFAAGHELANHSDAYEGLGSKSEEDIRISLEKVSALIQEITGNKPHYFRAPNLNYGDNLIKVCTDMGLPLIGASSIGQDWNAITAEEIKKNVINAAQDGGIIVLHENPYEESKYEATRKAIPGIVHELRMQGYEITSVGQLIQKKGFTLEAGKKYNTIP